MISVPGRRLLLTALGAPVDVVCGGSRAEELYAALPERWAWCERATPDGAARELRVELGPEHTGRAVTTVDQPELAGADLAQLLVDLTQHVTWSAVHAGVGRLLMFHAAGLIGSTGEAVVGVAPGGTGKTTLCRILGPGRGYLSDETIGITADGVVLPYPKPLSVRTPDGGPKHEVPPSGLGLLRPPGAAHVAAVLLLTRSTDGPAEPGVEELDLFDAAVALAPETSSLARLPRPLHHLAEVLEAARLVARVRYRESASLEPLVASLVGAR